jgi:iron complex outermembrane receptor protein
MVRLIFFLIMIFTSFSPALYASETHPETKLEEIVVVATKVERPLEGVPGRIDIIRREEIEEMPYQKVDDLLRYLSGINVVRNNGIYTMTPTCTLRGLSDEQARTLVLLDGIPLNKGDTGNVNFNRINPEEIERIEVFKGPASSIYGNNAMGGVINIVTKKPERKFEGSLSGQGGSFGTYIGDLIMSGKIGKTFYRLIAHGLNSDGYVSTPQERRTKYTVKRFAVENAGSFLLGYELNKENTLSFRADYYNDKRGEGTRIKHVNGVHRDFDTGAYSLTYKGKHGDLEVRLNLFYNLENYRRVSESERGVTYTRFDVDSDRIDKGADISLSVPFGSRNVFTFGGDIREGSVDAKDIYITQPDRTLNKGKLRLNGLWIQDEITLFGGRFNILAGIRYDHAHFFDGSFFSTLPQYSQFNGKIGSNTWEAFSPKISVKYKFRNDLSSYVSYGRGFRASILDDLCRSGIMWGLYKEANPNLKPEKLASYEIGFDFRPSSKLSFLGSIYYSIGTDFLYYVPTGRTILGRPLFRRENVAKVESKGLELEAKYEVLRYFSFSINYSLCKAEIKDFPMRAELEGQELTRTPRYQIKGGITYTGPLLSFSLLPAYKSYQWIYTNEMTQVVRRLGGYFVLDGKIWKDFGKSFRVSLDVFNIFDKKYMESPDERAPGITLMGKIKYSF